MNRSVKTKIVAAATVGVLSVGGVAYAATSGSAPTPLTGSSTDKISEAALAKYPGGTLVGVESEPDGTYEARVRKADGTQATATLDKTFKVTATREGGGRFGGPGGGFGHGGPGGHGGRFDTAALAKALGVTEAKLTAAIEKVRPDRDDKRTERAAAIAKALGVDAADVRSVLDDVKPAGGPGGGGRGFGGGGGRGPGGDPSALVTALAKKTGKTEAQVRAALQAARPDRADRKDELATALAKELGLDAAKVKTALEAQRPAGRP